MRRARSLPSWWLVFWDRLPWWGWIAVLALLAVAGVVLMVLVANLTGTLP